MPNKMINLLSVGVLGWIPGLGFMNIAKLYAPPEELPNIGYVLNICNVFLLVSIGINFVDNPLIKKYLLDNNSNKAFKTQTRTLGIYLGKILIICRFL